MKGLSQVEASLTSLELTLTKGRISQLNEVSRIDLGSPHGVIAASQSRLFGSSTGQIETKHAVR